MRAFNICNWGSTRRNTRAREIGRAFVISQAAGGGDLFVDFGGGVYVVACSYKCSMTGHDNGNGGVASDFNRMRSAKEPTDAFVYSTLMLTGHVAER
jgi:hypothetical protein